MTREAVNFVPFFFSRVVFLTDCPSRNARTSFAVKVVLLSIFSLDFFQITKPQPFSCPLHEKPDENSGVRWFALPDVLPNIREPEMRVVYQKLMDKCAALHL